MVLRMSNSDTLKMKLLERAARAKSRPSKFSSDAEERVLAIALNIFAYQDYDTYDVNFANNIQTARPDWFIDEHAINKIKLLEAAKKNWRDPEIVVYMGFYLVKSSRHFDMNLYAEIRLHRPDWFKKWDS